jgi:hypothetical protein
MGEQAPDIPDSTHTAIGGTTLPLAVLKVWYQRENLLFYRRGPTCFQQYLGI